jgi:hypothetical protein
LDKQAGQLDDLQLALDQVRRQQRSKRLVVEDGEWTPAEEQKRGTRLPPAQTDLELGLIAAHVPLTELSTVVELARQYFMETTNTVLPSTPIITARRARKLREDVLPLVAEAAAAIEIAGDENIAANLHSDGTTSSRSLHHANTLYWLKKLDGTGRSIRLAGYQLPNNCAESILAAHLGSVLRLREVMTRAKKACPRALERHDPAHLDVGFIHCYVSDHGAPEVRTFQLLQALVAENGQTLSQIFCQHHSRALVEKSLDGGEQAWLNNFHSLYYGVGIANLVPEWGNLSASAQTKLLAELQKNSGEPLEITALIHSIYQGFGYGTEPYVHGDGLSFRTWLVKHHSANADMTRLLRVVGSRHDVYFENPPVMYFMMEDYVAYLLEARQRRWGESAELNGLQKQLLEGLTCLPVRVCLRCRALFWYALFEPLRFLQGRASDSAPPDGFAHAHYAEITIGFLEEVLTTRGEYMLNRRVVDSIWKEEPLVAEWRQGKLGSSVYLRLVEFLFARDETDEHVATYSVCVAGPMLTAHAKVSKELAKFNSCSRDSEAERTRNSPFVNDNVERSNGILKDEQRRSPLISTAAAHGMTTARFNGTFKPSQGYFALPRAVRRVVLGIAWSELKRARTRAQENANAHLTYIYEQHEVGRQLQVEREHKQADRLIRLNAQQGDRVTTVEGLRARIKEIQELHTAGWSTEVVKFLTLQCQLRRGLARKKVGVPSLSKTVNGEKRTVEQLIALVEGMIEEEVKNGMDTPVVDHILEQLQPKKVLDQLKPRTLQGQKAFTAQAQRGVDAITAACAKRVKLSGKPVLTKAQKKKKQRARKRQKTSHP